MIGQITFVATHIEMNNAMLTVITDKKKFESGLFDALEKFISFLETKNRGKYLTRDTPSARLR